MKLEQFQQKVAQVLEKHDDEIVLEVAQNVLNGHELVGKTPYEVYIEILEYERQGKTGFDCGWIFLYPENDDELLSSLKRSVKPTKNIIPIDFYPSNYSSKKLRGFRVKSKKYPFNVQSITIKQLVAKAILDRVGIEYKVYTVLD